jgi:hypothetical protein
LLVSTVACIIVMNVVLAQVIAQTLYPGSGLRLGPAALAALAVAVLALVIYTVLGWRSYLK